MIIVVVTCDRQINEYAAERVPVLRCKRKPNYLTTRYFDFLDDNKLGHIFLQGYYMPSIFGVYEKAKDRLVSPVVIRLHGGDRKDIEERTKNSWDKVVDPRDDELVGLAGMVRDLREKEHQVFINVNNHYEGSAVKTIEKIRGLIKESVKTNTLQINK